MKYDGVDAPPECIARVDRFLNGDRFGAIQFNNESTSPLRLSRSFTSGLVGRPAVAKNTLTAAVSSASGCAESSIDSLRVQVIGVG